jgi:hypothetical protein
MPYPETTEGFACTDIKNWSTLTKQEVSRPQLPKAKTKKRESKLRF